MKFLLFFLFILTAHSQACAQDSLQISGFADLYYGYDFNKPADRNRHYTTQPLRHNEFNLNWGFIKAEYSRNRIRSSFAMQTGTFVQANYAYEPDLLKLIYLANVGYELANGLWIDAGVLPSHIGPESAVSIENWNYSRNLASDYSPYYQCGVHLSWEPTERLSAKFVVMNGFQIIHETNNAKSVGVMVNFKPTDKVEIGYSNYAGNEAPSDSVWINDNKVKLGAKYRFFNDIFVRCKATERLSFLLSGEYNLQERFDSSENANWFSATAILIYSINNKLSVAGRAEHFADRHQVVATTETPDGFIVKSATVTLNYFPVQDFAVRLEARTFKSKNRIYPTAPGLRPSFSDSFIVVSAACKF